MATIPVGAFNFNDSPLNLDTAAKFYVAGAYSTVAVPAKPTNNPPIGLIPAASGVAANLLPYFNYESKQLAGIRFKSKFSCLLDLNEKLEAGLGDTQAAIGSIVGIANVANFKTPVANLSIPDATTLEQCLYALATSNSNVNISRVKIGTATYIYLEADYQFDRVVQGGGY